MSAVTSRFDANPRTVSPSPVPHLLRGSGVAELVLGQSCGETRLLHLYQKTPCRVLFPNTHRGELVTAVVLTTSGGLTGGDRIRIELSSRANAKAVVTTQAAEKIYRSSDVPCIIDTKIEAEAGSWLEWIPQETILFDECCLRRSTTITAQPGAEVIAGDIVVFGRIAYGEVFTKGSLRDAWKVYSHGRPAWLDTLVLDEAPAISLGHPAGFDGAQAMGTFIYVADQAVAHVDTARSFLDQCPMRCGVTCVNNVLIIRFLARDPHALRMEYMQFWSAFRAAVKGLPARVPRVWEC